MTVGAMDVDKGLVDYPVEPLQLSLPILTHQPMRNISLFLFLWTWSISKIHKIKDIFRLEKRYMEIPMVFELNP